MPKTVPLNFGQARTILNRKDRIGIVASGRPHRRVGFRAFMTFLEYRHFQSWLPVAADFDLMLVDWMEIEWWLCVFTKNKLAAADELLKSVGLRRADGVPHIIDGSHHHFPIDAPNLFTAEYVAESFVYHSREEELKALQAEDLMCDKEIERGREIYEQFTNKQTMQMRARYGRV